MDPVAALRAGRLVVLPTDTVYGLCADPFRAEPVRRLYRLKGRPESQPTAILFDSVATLVDSVPGLPAPAMRIARALLPGPYTLILPNPVARFRWLTGDRADTIGVRVPAVAGAAADVLAAVGAVAATSANVPGAPEARRLEEVPEELRAGCGAVLDGGELPGAPSTILDLTGEEPRVLREGAVEAREALARARAAVGRRE